MTPEQPFCQICSSLNLWQTTSAIHALWKKKKVRREGMICICYYLARLWFSNSFQTCLCPSPLKAELQNVPELKHRFECFTERIGPVAKTGSDVRSSTFFTSIPAVTPSTFIQAAGVRKESIATRWAAFSIAERQPLAFGGIGGRQASTQATAGHGCHPAAARPGQMTLGRRTGHPAPPRRRWQCQVWKRHLT